jgi:hypothetical protein
MNGRGECFARTKTHQALRIDCRRRKRRPTEDNRWGFEKSTPASFSALRLSHRSLDGRVQ